MLPPQANHDRADYCWRIRNKLRILQFKYYTRLAYVEAYLWGIELKSKCTFLGRTSFSRHPGSNIKVGEACDFRSGYWTNRIGPSRPCMISTLTDNALIKIGNRVGMSGTVIASGERIVIGDDVLCGANVTITDTDWHTVNPQFRRVVPPALGVAIEDNVWLGFGVVVLKGVTIGKNTVVAAYSVVNRNLPANVIAGGQPARILKHI